MDNCKEVTWQPHIFRAQKDAIIFYCEKLFKSNPDNAVCIYLMTSWRILVGPTRDLQEILSHLEHVPGRGETYFSYALATACKTLSHTPTHMKRRLLLFVASRIDLELGFSHPSSYGTELKKRGVTVNVFSFLSKWKTHKYAKDLLDAFDTAVSSDGISSIQDVHDESRIRDMLSESILKENLDYISKMACNEKNGAAAGVRDIEISDLSGIKKMFGPCNHNAKLRYQPPERAWARASVSVKLIKKTIDNPYLREVKSRKAEEDVSVKQELELSCNEKNKAAAEYGKTLPPL